MVRFWIALEEKQATEPKSFNGKIMVERINYGTFVIPQTSLQNHLKLIERSNHYYFLKTEYIYLYHEFNKKNRKITVQTSKQILKQGFRYRKIYGWDEKKHSIYIRT